MQLIKMSDLKLKGKRVLIREEFGMCPLNTVL